MNCPNAGALNIEDEGIELRGQCELKGVADWRPIADGHIEAGPQGCLDAFFVYASVVKAGSAEASLAEAVKDREER